MTALLFQQREESTQSQSRLAKIELIDELIASNQERLSEEDNVEELVDQLKKLDEFIAQEQQALKVSEEKYQGFISHRDQLRRKYQNGLERRGGEIKELLARFSLLDEHYQVDLERLEGIREAGLLVATLSPQACPLCGAEPLQQHRDAACDGNLETIIIATDAERKKIGQLRRELADTVLLLNSEGQSFDRLIPKVQEEVKGLEEELKAIGSKLMEHRTTYSEIVDNVRLYVALYWPGINSMSLKNDALN